MNILCLSRKDFKNPETFNNIIEDDVIRKDGNLLNDEKYTWAEVEIKSINIKTEDDIPVYDV